MIFLQLIFMNEHAALATQYVDVLQIPAFLSAPDRFVDSPLL